MFFAIHLVSGLLGWVTSYAFVGSKDDTIDVNDADEKDSIHRKAFNKYPDDNKENNGTECTPDAEYFFSIGEDRKYNRAQSMAFVPLSNLFWLAVVLFIILWTGSGHNPKSVNRTNFMGKLHSTLIKGNNSTPWIFLPVALFFLVAAGFGMKWYLKDEPDPVQEPCPPSTDASADADADADPDDDGD